MTESINHYEKAVELAIKAEDHLRERYGKIENAVAYTRLGQLHLDLHHGQPQIVVATDDPYWALAADLEALQAAALELLASLRLEDNLTNAPWRTPRTDTAREALLELVTE